MGNVLTLLFIFKFFLPLWSYEPAIDVLKTHYNLYHTSYVNKNDLYYDCLYYDLEELWDYDDKAWKSHLTIPYCIRPVDIDDTPIENISSIVTFEQLKEKNVTAADLFLWSASIDLIENYQDYISNNISKLYSQIFHNCTSPWFGSTCQYIFDYSDEPFSEIVKMKFSQPILVSTCYNHLRCDRFVSTICLDWREICDGKVDCIDGIDENDCIVLEINQCTKNEFQCGNGMCIPLTFFNRYSTECLDGTDTLDSYQAMCNEEPGFRCEETTCRSSTLFSCGDGQCSSFNLPRGGFCESDRMERYISELYSYEKNPSLSYHCWQILMCLFHGWGNINVQCTRICNRSINYCGRIVPQHCPSTFFFPSLPILQNHVRLAYFSNRTFPNSTYFPLYPDIVCYDPDRCPFLPATINISSLSCRLFSEIELIFNQRREMTLEDFFSACLLTNTSTVNTTLSESRHLMLFHCNGTPKYISKRRLLDGNADCYQAVDENAVQLCATMPNFQCAIKENCISDGTSLFRSHCSSAKVNNLAFHKICNKYIDIDEPVLIEALNETDETNCDLWPCNNQYTRCDGAWHCLNGIDELNCTSEYKCPFDHHPCISPETIELTCLPVRQAGDGIPNCLGATDERDHCRQLYPDDLHVRYRCWNDTKCIEPCALCGSIVCDRDACPNENIEEVCERFDKSPLARNYRDQCGRDINLERPLFEYFSLRDTNDYLSTTTLDYITLQVGCATRHQHSDKKKFIISENGNTVNSFNKQNNHINLIQMCNRGIMIRMSENNGEYCLCPPSYYGDQCQYQSQRVSLTLLFRRLSGMKYETFSFVIELIENMETIHYFEHLIYVSSVDCDAIYNINLLYKNRSKDLTMNYAVRIVAYNIIDLVYYSSWYFPITFLFLPVNRMSIHLIIGRPNKLINSHCPLNCIHGQCLKYTNAEHYFCRCEKGWSGSFCSIKYECNCSSDSYCHGWVNNQSICVCPLEKYGPRCLIPSICTTSNKCKNGGICVPSGKRGNLMNIFTCICLPGFTGLTCETIDNRIDIFFNNIPIPQSILLHLIQVNEDTDPSRITRFYKISLDQDMISVYPTESFHLVFAQIDTNFFLLITQEKHTPSVIISTQISSSRRCPSIRELFSEQRLLNLPLLRRVKYYHSTCDKHPSLTCFHDDDTFMCLCNRYRHANCFHFDFNMRYRCQGLSDCENDAQCFDDHLTCPKSTICVCSECFYGSKCQFSTKGFSLSLDAIIGYQVRHRLSIIRQPATIQFTLAVTTLMFIVGLISSILSIITFRSKKTREVGCGVYLLVSSNISLIISILFTIKFWFLLFSQMTMIKNRNILLVSCFSNDFILRLLLSIGEWLNVCVSMERVVNVTMGTNFDGKKSKRIAPWIILIVVLITTGSLVHDPIHRHLIDDEDDERIWCIVRYTTHIETFNSIISIVHFIVPLCLNLISAIVIIVIAARNRSISRQQQNYKEHLKEQFQQHKHLLVSPLVLALLAVPRIIISLLTGCMKSARNPWLFLVSYFISYIPPSLIFVVFILPSDKYKKHFYEEITRIKKDVRRFLRFNND